MANIFEPIRKILKIKKICLLITSWATSKQPRGPHAARGLGSLGLELLLAVQSLWE